MANITPIKTGDVLTLTMWGTLYGSRMLNVLHYQVRNLATPLTDAEVEIAALVDRIFTDAGSFWKLLQAQVSPEYTLNYVRAQKVFDLRYPYFNYGYEESGTHTGQSETSNVDAVIVKRSAHVGRGRSGDFHVAGIPNNEIDGALLQGAYVTSLQNVANQLAEDVAFTAGPAYWRPIVGVPKLITDPHTDMIEAVVQKEVRVMVKRTAFRGI